MATKATKKEPAKPAKPAKPEWTQAHQDALDAMRVMKVPEKEARKLLEGLETGEAGDLMRQALRARNAGVVRRPQVPAGGPANAMPVNPPTAQARPSLRSFVPKPPQIAAGSASQGPRINLRGFTPQPSSPAIAQLSPPSMGATNAPDRPAMPGPGADVKPPPYTQIIGAPPGWKPSDAGLVKPRIRVRAAGGPVPAAPLGAATPSIEQGPPTNAPVTPTAAPQAPSTQAAPLPRIRSEEEYEKIPPGQRFVWIPDGHIYRKPAQPAQGGE